MNYRELIDPELRKSAKSFPFNKPVVAVGNVYQGAEWRFVKAPEGIREEEIEIEGSQGHLFRTSVFTPAGAEDYLPALLYVHGGAFVYKAASYQKRLAFIYAEKAECKVFFPHYRLAPKFRFPAAYEDVLSLCRYMMEHAIELGIDPDRSGLPEDCELLLCFYLCIAVFSDDYEDFRACEVERLDLCCYRNSGHGSRFLPDLWIWKDPCFGCKRLCLFNDRCGNDCSDLVCYLGAEK